jgi:NAD(P)-dependent dehydrogenase (short-subunit alcohol dehydrogenase family)
MGDQGDAGDAGAAKSAAWSLTHALRLELAPKGTRVTALDDGYMDTDMTRHLDVPKSDPAHIASGACRCRAIARRIGRQQARLE